MSEPPGGALAVSVSGLRKRFVVAGWLPGRAKATIDALQGLDLEVEAGTIHGIIGPNGSGKSTLLRILSTLVIGDDGAATVAGHDVGRARLQVRRAIGFSTGDERSLYWRLTGRQNLEFHAALCHVPDPEVAIETALATANIVGAADRPVAGYSQGMVRRLGLARALLHRPSVLLLDEPTRSLDLLARDDFHRALRHLRGTGTVTTLLTTHDLAEAHAICDVVSVLKAGRIVGRFAPPDEATLEAALRQAEA